MIDVNLPTVKVRILSDWTFDEDGSPPVEAGTVVLGVLPGNEGYLMEPGEVWYIRPDTGEEWLSLPADYEVVND